MVINTNISALNTVNQLNKNSNSMNSALEKLSSGYQINSAADDAAGLAISEKMRSQIRGLDQASDNAQDAISLTQTADGALDETESILQRMRELSVQASSDSLTDDDRSSFQDEVDQLRQEIDRISDDTEYNTKSLLDGSLSSTVTVSGANSSMVATVSALSSAESGTYDAIVTSAATQATIATSTYSTLTITDSTASIGSSYNSATITINDSTITLSSTDTLSGIVDEINTLTEDTGVTAKILTSAGAATSATAGTATGSKDLSSGASITTGTNDTLTLTVDGGTATDITIANGTYSDSASLLTAINNAISSAGLGVTASIDSTSGALTFTSGTTGSTSSVTVDSGSNAYSTLMGTATSTAGTAAGSGSTYSYIQLTSTDYGSKEIIQYGICRL
jgi:flagellin